MKNLIKIPYFKQRVAVVKLCTVCALFFVISNCSDQNEECECELPSLSIGMAVNCPVYSFMEGVSMYSECSNVYVIKGIALDEYEYGRNIQLVEDLKGNFPKDVDTFVAWGDGRIGIAVDRSDYLNIYDNQDVLIMLLMSVRNLAESVPPEFTWIEKPEDYCTFPCVKSVLRLSDGYVTGIIAPCDVLEDQTMPWNDFQKELKKLLKSKK